MQVLGPDRTLDRVFQVGFDPVDVPPIVISGGLHGLQILQDFLLWVKLRNLEDRCKAKENVHSPSVPVLVEDLEQAFLDRSGVLEQSGVELIDFLGDHVLQLEPRLVAALVHAGRPKALDMHLLGVLQLWDTQDPLKSVLLQ